jgi:DNA-directed RNA polymerase specialized sigma24 family protein
VTQTGRAIAKANKLASLRKQSYHTWTLPITWLTGNDTDAEDVVQEAYCKQSKFFSGFQGADRRSWLLAIVRNTCYT